MCGKEWKRREQIEKKNHLKPLPGMNEAYGGSNNVKNESENEIQEGSSYNNIRGNKVLKEQI